MSETTEKRHLMEWTKAELLALPHRPWGADGIYTSVMILPTGKRHESGWGAIAIIGVQDGIPTEIATVCSDDLEWKMPTADKCGGHLIGQMRMDCAPKSKALHAWCRRGKFHVGAAISSIDIELKPE